MIRGHLRPIPKVRPHGLYYVYYPVGFFFCDRPHLTPSDKKLGATREVLVLFRLFQATAKAVGQQRCGDTKTAESFYLDCDTQFRCCLFVSSSLSSRNPPREAHHTFYLSLIISTNVEHPSSNRSKTSSKPSCPS